MQLEIGKRKLHLIHLVSKKKKKGLFGDKRSLTTSHLLLLDVTLCQNYQNTEMAIKIPKNGQKKYLKHRAKVGGTVLFMATHHFERFCLTTYTSEQTT